MSLRLTYVLLLFIPLLITGCDTTDAPEEDPAAPDETLEVVESRFGSPYEFVVNPRPAAPDSPPGIQRDTLFAQVAYRGGCEDHDFELEHEVARDTSRLWLRHHANRDDCDEHITEDLAIEVPAEARDASTILLLNPQGYEPFVLRWRRPQQ